MKSTTVALVAGLCGVALLACDHDDGGKASASAEAAAPSASASASASSAPSASTASASTTPASPFATLIPAPPDVAAPPADAKKTASGLASKVLTPGKGKDHPGRDDRVKIQYTAWTKDGTMVDSSVARGGDPPAFVLNDVIRGWMEGIPLMVVGEKRRFWIPAAMAYGEHPRMGPAGDLTYDVELLEIIPAPKPIPAPQDVKAAPPGATKTASGLAYKVLVPGTGKDHPTPGSSVIVNYTGWTTDGHMFDSSVVRGQPARLSLGRVIKGWTEGLQLMTKGEKARFWIPSSLGYGDTPSRPGAPSGTLVFDIELIDFQ